MNVFSSSSQNLSQTYRRPLGCGVLSIGDKIRVHSNQQFSAADAIVECMNESNYANSNGNQDAY